MKKVLFILLAILLIGCHDRKMDVYEVVDKGVHTTNGLFSGDINYYITLRNVKTGKTYGYKCRSGNEYYRYVKGKKYYFEF